MARWPTARSTLIWATKTLTSASEPDGTTRRDASLAHNALAQSRNRRNDLSGFMEFPSWQFNLGCPRALRPKTWRMSWCPRGLSFSREKCLRVKKRTDNGRRLLDKPSGLVKKGKG